MKLTLNVTKCILILKLMLQNKKKNWLRKDIAPTPSDMCIIYCL